MTKRSIFKDEDMIFKGQDVTLKAKSKTCFLIVKIKQGQNLTFCGHDKTFSGKDKTLKA